MKRLWPNSEAPLAVPREAEAGSIDSESIRRQLEKILASPEFANASRLREFLSFVVEEVLNGASAIKEVAVAMRIFNRRASFDSSGDSVVRVSALHLRKRLRDYYAGSGQGEEIVIEIPKGSYVPVFGRAAKNGAPATNGRRRLWSTAAAGAVILAAAVAAIWIAWAWHGGRDRSIAILPMSDLGDSRMQTLCQGLTEDLTTELARLHELRVIARTSASQFPAHGADVREIGKRLGVATVLEGSIRQQGNQMRFTAQLIETRSGSHVWSEAYDREAKDPLAAEAAVTQLIAAAAARHLGVSGPSAAPPPHVPTAAAHELYWKARYLRSLKVNMEAWEQADGLLKEAVRLDPQYLQAWSSLATLAANRAFHRSGPFEDLTAEAESAAAKALELDPRNPEGQVTLAEMKWIANRDWPAAERDFRRVVELNPNFAAGHGWFATALWAHGHFDEALRELDRAVALDPLPYVVSNDRAAILYCARRYGESIARARQVLAIDSSYWPAHLNIGNCLLATGHYAEAIREFRLVPDASGPLGQALALTGQRAEALGILRSLEAEVGQTGNGRVHSAYIQAGLGDHAAALASLEDAYAQHETDVNFIGVDPRLDALRGEPRFRALLKKLGL
jgi:TolB-like protein/Tfp pilus assembly protein PilF